MTSYEITQYIPSKLIDAKINDLANQIANYYQSIFDDNDSLVLLVILKGSVIFFSDLIRKLFEKKISVTTEFISISSYGGSTESSGQIRFELDTRNSITDKHVLIVEDIIDTGRSLDAVVNNLKSKSPKSLEIVTLLSKQSRREIEVPVKFIGFDIPDEFVVGYGLDFNEKYRELPYIGTLKFINYSN
jgi:hypoxanthine phosphoribosyltransferase